MEDQESKEASLLHVEEGHLKCLLHLELDTSKTCQIKQDEAIIKQYLLSREDISQAYVLYGNKSVLVMLKSAELNTKTALDSIADSLLSEFGIHLHKTNTNSHLYLTSELDEAKLALLSKDKSIALKIIESKTGLRLKKLKKKIFFAGYLFQFVLLEQMLTDYENRVVEPANEFAEWRDKYENSVHKFTCWINNAQVYVFKADCAELNTGLIVNFTNANLHPGYTGNDLSRRIREKAGKQMQECLKKMLQAKKYEESELCDTRASGRLRCRHVVHSVCPQWTKHITDKIEQRQVDLEKFESLIQATLTNIVDLANESKFGECESMAMGLSTNPDGGSWDLPLPVFVHYFFSILSDKKLVNAKHVCLVSVEESTVIDTIALLKDYSEQCSQTRWAMPESPLEALVSALMPIEQLAINCGHKEKTGSSNSPSSCSSSSSISPIRIAKSVNRPLTRENHFYPICDGQIYVRKINEPCAGYERYSSILVTFEIFDGIQNQSHPRPGSPYKGLVKRAYLPDIKEHMEILAFYKKALKSGILFKLEWSKKFANYAVQLNSDVLLKTNLNEGGKFGYPDMNYIDDLLVKARTTKA